MVDVVDAIAKEGWQAVVDEEAAYETIVVEGVELIRAMRTLAMRLDRAALLGSEGEEE
jgi:hypothetical protein